MFLIAAWCAVSHNAEQKNTMEMDVKHLNSVCQLSILSWAEVPELFKLRCCKTYSSLSLVFKCHSPLEVSCSGTNLEISDFHQQAWPQRRSTVHLIRRNRRNSAHKKVTWVCVREWKREDMDSDFVWTSLR